MGASIDAIAVGAWCVVTAAGDLDIGVVPRLRTVLTDLLDAGAAAVVDLSGVSLLDCACIHVLAQATRRATTSGIPLRVVGARGAVQRVLQITGVVGELNVDAPARRFPRQDSAAETVEAVLAARAVLPTTDQRRDLLRERAVQASLPMAETLAGRYRRPNEPIDELAQIAVVGMLKAVDRFDPARGSAFLGFAVPTVLGELRRYFRDRTWGVHVPRHMQELRLSVNQAAGSMAQTLHRDPTVTELADLLDETVEDVREAMVAAQGYAPASLSQPVGDGGGLELGDLIGAPDEDLERVDHHDLLDSLMAALPERERQAIAWRFFGDMTQAQIAGILGVSQMQVSRLLTRALARMRAEVLAAEAA